MTESAPFERPLRTLFLLSSMPVGGAETLLVNLVRRFDRERIAPMIGCMKERDVLGESIADEVPVFDQLIRHKYDVPVVGRLKELFEEEKIDALITVGAGDKMFWGRIAAKRAQVPVVLSALHSTGWPDGVGRLNRMLTRITDGFIAVARQHAEFQVNQEKFPAEKVFLIPNGIDTDQFVFDPSKRTRWRTETGIPLDAPVVGIVAALRPEKDHRLFLAAAKNVLRQIPTAHFLIAGDGIERPGLEALVQEWGMSDAVHFTGSTDDVAGVLSAMDLFALTSKNEASPVSILEAFSCERPVVAPDVGSISETVLHGKTGWLVPQGNVEQLSQSWVKVLSNPEQSQQWGRAGRQHVIQNGSVNRMTEGYTQLIESFYSQKSNPAYPSVPDSLFPVRPEFFRSSASC